MRQKQLSTLKLINRLEKLFLSKFSIVSMQRLISLYATSHFMECKTSALSRNFSLCVHCAHCGRYADKVFKDEEASSRQMCYLK